MILLGIFGYTTLSSIWGCLLVYEYTSIVIGYICMCSPFLWGCFGVVLFLEMEGVWALISYGCRVFCWELARIFGLDVGR